MKGREGPKTPAGAPPGAAFRNGPGPRFMAFFAVHFPGITAAGRGRTLLDGRLVDDLWPKAEFRDAPFGPATKCGPVTSRPALVGPSS